MGQLTDTLRATLRDLAQSDARLYRGLQQELGELQPTTEAAAPQLTGDAPASREELEALSGKVLWELCKQRGIKGLSNGPKARQIEALLHHLDGPPLRSALPSKADKGAPGTTKATGQTRARPGADDLQAMAQRLDRLEQLVLLIAQQVGVPPEAIAQLLVPAAPPT